MKYKTVQHKGLFREDITNKIRIIRKMIDEKKNNPEIYNALKKRLPLLLKLREEFKERSRTFKKLDLQRKKNTKKVFEQIGKYILTLEIDLMKFKINAFVVSNNIPKQFDPLIAYLEDLKFRLKRYNLIQLQKHISLLDEFIKSLKSNPDPSIYSVAQEKLRDVERRVREVFFEIDQIVSPNRNIVINTRESFD